MDETVPSKECLGMYVLNPLKFLEGVSTIPDECRGVGSEISAEPKRKTIEKIN